MIAAKGELRQAAALLSATRENQTFVKNADSMQTSSAESSGEKRARAICFYLPQFHPTPENNRWWGEGFTEWTNVAAAKPRFAGHYQPHLPGALGFYDLRLEEVRVAQANLAAQYGIHGFCYYHYWFAGTRLLHRPLDALLASGVPDFPFCLCWANESWSRAWSGREQDVLMAQTYADDDHARHIDWLAGPFTDRRYIRIDGRPLLLIYRPESIPNTGKVLDRWRKRCHSTIGTEPFLCGVRTGFASLQDSWKNTAAFDAVLDFHPNREYFPTASNVAGRAVASLRRLLPQSWYDLLRDNRLLGSRTLNTVIDYREYVKNCISRDHTFSGTAGPSRFPCVFPSWDNSARRKSATIIENHDPSAYAYWLSAALDQVSDYEPEHRLVFINAWNEWAEGCHLEPDQHHGLSFLEATKSTLEIVGQKKAL